MTGMLPGVDEEVAEEQTRPRGGVLSVLDPSRRRVHRPKSIVVILSMIWIAIILIVAVTVQWLPIHSYVTIAGNINTDPNWGKEFLGTDNIGRSVLSRLLWGARVSITISFIPRAWTPAPSGSGSRRGSTRPGGSSAPTRGSSSC